MGKYLYAIVLLTAFGSWAMGQTMVSGTVLGEDDNASIPGVAILVKGTTQGTVTDVEG